ncbi:hypothetical protein RYX36_003972 [Vicia faba]
MMFKMEELHLNEEQTLYGPYLIIYEEDNYRVGAINNLTKIKGSDSDEISGEFSFVPNSFTLSSRFSYVLLPLSCIFMRVLLL